MEEMGRGERRGAGLVNWRAHTMRQRLVERRVRVAGMHGHELLGPAMLQLLHVPKRTSLAPAGLGSHHTPSHNHSHYASLPIEPRPDCRLH